MIAVSPCAEESRWWRRLFFTFCSCGVAVKEEFVEEEREYDMLYTTPEDRQRRLGDLANIDWEQAHLAWEREMGVFDVFEEVQPEKDPSYADGASNRVASRTPRIPAPTALSTIGPAASSARHHP